MSLYSGFQTKQLHQQYDKLVSLLIVTLTKRVVKFYTKEECNEFSFKNIVNKIVSSMKSFEQQKFMPPRFSESVELLSEIIQEKEAIDNDKLFSSNGFDTITNKANLLLNHDPITQLQPIQLRQTGEDLPPHPSEFIEQSEKSSNIESEKIGVTERNEKIEMLVRKNNRSENGITSMATPRRGSYQKQYQQIPISQEFIQQIEESVTQNLLDKLTFQRKKKRQKSDSNSMQFRKLLLQPTEKANQSFQITRKSVYKNQRDSFQH